MERRIILFKKCVFFLSSRNYRQKYIISIYETKGLMRNERLVAIQSNNLARDVLSPSLLVVHDTSRGCEDNVSELTRREKFNNPLLHIRKANVVPWRDTSGLVDASIQLDDNLARTVIIDFLKFANITCRQEINVRICV